MINRFKIWFNRNNYKIMMIIVITIILYAAIKGLNSYSQSSLKNSDNIVAKSDIYDQLEGEYLFEDKENIETYEKVNTSEEEYNIVQSIFKNLLDKIANARKNDDSEIKEELYDMCLDDFIDEMTSIEEEPDVDNILNYYPGVETSTIDKYYIGEIYRFYRNNEVKGYIIETRYDMGNNNYENNFMVIYVDYENNTFLYGGGYASLERIDTSIDVDSIDDNGGNTF